MKNKQIEFHTVEMEGVKLDIEGYWDGGHYPATRETPEENPEFSITRITTSGDITELLTERQLERIYSKI